MTASVPLATRSSLFTRWKREAAISSSYLACTKVSIVLRYRPETYDIDPAKLEANFKNMQKVIHPDLFSSKSAVGILKILLSIGREGSLYQSFHNHQYCTQQTEESHFTGCLSRRRIAR